MTDEEIKKQILDYISKNLVSGGQPISENTELISTSLLDSLNLVSLTLFLEKIGKRKIPATDVRPENMNTVRQMVHYLQK